VRRSRDKRRRGRMYDDIWKGRCRCSFLKRDGVILRRDGVTILRRDDVMILRRDGVTILRRVGVTILRRDSILRSDGIILRRDGILMGNGIILRRDGIISLGSGNGGRFKATMRNDSI
jgi:hypothetical protein